MLIYVAGSSKDIARCESVIARLRALGHEISFDWPSHIRANPGGANVGSDDVLEEAAELCLQGALDADLVWVLNPPVDKPTAGAWGEMVAAVAIARLALLPLSAKATRSAAPRTIISAPDGPKQFCIFQHLKGVTRLDNDEAGFLHVLQLADRRPDDRSPAGA